MKELTRMVKRMDYSKINSWEDFLGQRLSRKKSYRSFESARKFARKLGLKSTREWRMYYQGKLKDLPPIPSDIPATPDNIYKNKGWISWPDFLGYEPKRKKK
jgi:hypothetical protein